ncbi:pyrophosphorylase [Catellatospora sp. IY07-71]|uniref:bifunctional cytidylyltransferase/SDR family oxidoreductase n=1 Tax=Catellatospora sp. IY07-71 TaxID=2728827 RepID=UPI001BB34ABE|nr:bifunctional cytidylyltransferase/SDR family oxidoreductase [Catellatospora sp. IY07-71]BCJ71976.1 pyrophosphorylase [Catellatospora sp. IY07-71]
MIDGDRLTTVAVILAGGTGERIGLKLPKQLIKVAGKPVLRHTLETFVATDRIAEIIILMTPNFVEDVEKIVADLGSDKPITVLAGGSTRSETTMKAIAALDGRECNILLHDAVRPLVDQRIIGDCVTALGRHEAIDVAIPSADTIIVTEPAEGGEIISDIPDRAKLRRGQTPQGFRLSVLRRAYELAMQDPDFKATDDCGVVRRYLPEVPIYVVHGSEQNMKITHPVDIYLADRLFQLGSHLAPVQPTREAYEAGIAGRTAVVLGGSYGIGGETADLLESYGAKVYRFSRSLTGTHLENPAHVKAALAQAYAETGRIDFIVNTAGVLHIGKIDEVDESIIDETVRVNYLGPVVLARESLRYLRETQGSLLFYTSSSYTRGRADYSLYSSTKAAIVNLTQALADEWSDHGVRVNCINPERTRTPMRTKAFGDEPENSLLDAGTVALTSVDVLISSWTGHIIDVRQGERSAGPVDPYTFLAEDMETPSEGSRW